MGMPRGLAKATNYYNKLEAWRDWSNLCAVVVAAGRSDLATKFSPNDKAGWRTIDKCTAKLREAYSALHPCHYCGKMIEKEDFFCNDECRNLHKSNLAAALEPK